MGGSVSQIFRSGSSLLSDNKTTSTTAQKIQIIFDVLRANPKVSMQRLESLLVEIPKHEFILTIHDSSGYNLLQKSVGLNHVELVKWVLHRHRPDVNRSPCSLPLHIACLRGYEECVELLLKHGARIDTEARMCFSGQHSHNCEESGKYKSASEVPPTTSTKLQNALCYAIDGDQISVLNILAQKMEEPWKVLNLIRGRKPLLHLACERGAWKCVQQLVTTRQDEINFIKDEFFPIHQAVLHDLKFLELLIHHEAETTVKTSTQQMTLLHVVILTARKSAEDTLNTIRILLEHGCKELINTPDYLGNTPLHAIIVRYALEEARYGYDKWNKWDVLHLVRYLLQNGAKASINQPGNSAMACVFRHIRDWDVCYEILNMLIKEDGDPNIVGRDGSVPLMVCLVPLINKDPLHHFTHTMKVCYLNCIRILLQHGANANCSYRSNLTPLHVLIFTVSENFTLNDYATKRANFDFVKNILLLLLQHGLDCNRTSQHILQSVTDMVQNVRTFPDILCIYELTLTLIQYGANPNIGLNNKMMSGINVALFGELSGGGSNLSRSHGPPVANQIAVAVNNESLRSSFRSNSRNFILFYYIMLITRKEFILTDPEAGFKRIVYLLYYTMEHDLLYSCLRSLHNLFVYKVPSKSTESLLQLISSLYRKPRSLKQSCRVRIYECLDKKLAQNLSRLKLPGPLKEYMLNFE